MINSHGSRRPHRLVRRADGTLADIGKLRAEAAANIRSSTDAVAAKTLQAAPLESVRAYLTRGARLGGLANSQVRTVADIQSVPARALTQVPGSTSAPRRPCRPPPKPKPTTSAAACAHG